MPNISVAAADSAKRISGVPRVPNSPRVKSTMPTFLPSANCLRIVPDERPSLICQVSSDCTDLVNTKSSASTNGRG
jgi:hypothetical protein